MVTDHTNLKNMTIDELAGVVNLYPWFGAARKELCLRISRLGGKSIGDNDYTANALYIGSRRIVSDIVRAASTRDYSDKNLENVLKALTTQEVIQEEAEEVRPKEAPKRSTRVAGGDFFSQDEYDKVRSIEDNVFSRFASSVRSEKEKGGDEMLTAAFCTETLARIYIEQGYYEQALFIYRQFLLRYPEKSTYFASLIEKLEQIDNQIDRI